MNILKYINIPVFIIAFALGMFAVYIFVPDNKKIIVYPTHENAHLLQYRDKANNCFSIEESNVICPSKKSDISSIPPQS